MAIDTPSRPAGAGQRGPLRRAPVRRPTGFRTDDATRLQLEVAAALFGDATLQGVIQTAVEEYLRTRSANKEFVRAVNLARRARSDEG